MDLNRESRQKPSTLRTDSCIEEKLLTGIARMTQDEAKGGRITQLFPELRAGLERAATVSGLDPLVLSQACRHVLCAEALLEILEQGNREGVPDAPGSVSKNEQADEVTALYSDLAGRKLAALYDRPKAEVSKIVESYPEINLNHVMLACRKGMISWSSAAGVLEESFQYERLLRELNDAGLLEVGANGLK